MSSGKHPTTSFSKEIKELYIYPGESLKIHLVEKNRATRQVVARVTSAGEAEVFPEVDGASCLGDYRKLFT